MKFNPGQIVMTRGVNDLIADNAEFAKHVIPIPNQSATFVGSSFCSSTYCRPGKPPVTGGHWRRLSAKAVFFLTLLSFSINHEYKVLAHDSPDLCHR